MLVIVSNKGNMPAGDTATCTPSRSAILYRAVRDSRGLRNANSVSLVFCSRDWYRFYRYQSRALDVPANPHRVPHSGRIFTATTESRCRQIIESQSCIRLLPAPLSLAAHTRRAVSGFVETSFLRQWLTTMRIATKTLQGPAQANDSRGAFTPHSHSIVAGGLPEMSYTTRLIPRTSLMIRFDARPSSAYGRCAQCAVMKSVVCTARSDVT